MLLRAFCLLFLFVWTTVSVQAQALPQTITIVPVADLPVTSAPFQVLALASSRLAVELSVDGPALLHGRLVTLTGVGTVTVTATQAGNAQYSPATATMSFHTLPGVPTVTWNAPGRLVYGQTLAAASGGPVAMASPYVDPSMDAAVVGPRSPTPLLGSEAMVYPPESPAFRYEGESMGPATSAYANAYAGVALKPPYGLLYRVAFTCDCEQFEFGLQARGESYRLSVDGAWTSPDSTPDIDDFPWFSFFTVHFPDKRKRQIKLAVSSNAPFYGVNTIGADTVSAPETPLGPRVFIFGDSWTGPTILPPPDNPHPPGLTGGGYPQALGEYFNWDWWDDGIGGSGFTGPGIDILARTWVERVATDVCPNAAEKVLLLGSVNDGVASAAALQSAIETTMGELAACLPGAPIYFAGVQTSEDPSAPRIEAVDRVVAAENLPNVSFIDPAGEHWFYGDSSDPSTGNWYGFINGHPTPAGHDFLAEELAVHLLAIDPTLAPKPYALNAPEPLTGTWSYAPAADALLTPGPHTLAAQFAPTDQAHFATATATAVVEVVAAGTTVSASFLTDAAGVHLAATLAPQYGGVPTGQVAVEANGTALATMPLNNGIGTATIPAKALEALGAGSHELLLRYAGDANFLPSSTALTVPPADFSFFLAHSIAAVIGITTVNIPLTISPSNGFTGTLTATCAGLPVGMSCQLVQNPISVNGAPTQTVLTLTSSGSGTLARMGAQGSLPGAPQQRAKIAAAGMLVLLLRSRKHPTVKTLGTRTLKNKVAATLLVALGAVTLACAMGCGVTTTTQTYSVAVTLSSETPALTHTAMLTVARKL